MLWGEKKNEEEWGRRKKKREKEKYNKINRGDRGMAKEWGYGRRERVGGVVGEGRKREERENKENNEEKKYNLIIIIIIINK